MQIDFFQVLKSIPGHLYWKDVAGCYLGCNWRVAQAAGLQSEFDIIGKTDFDLPWRQMAETIHENEQQVIRSGLSIVNEEKRMLADGTEVIFLTNIVPLFGEEQQVVGVIAIALDISEYKKAEKTMHEKLQEAEQANHAKAQLLATVCHELRTPLAGILGMVHALQKLSLPSQAKEYINDIKFTSDHVVSLTNDLLDVAKMAAGKMELALTPFNLSDLISQCLAILNYQMTTKKIKLETKIAAHVPKLIISDERALKQIIINLLSNAIKFTQEGSVLLEVEMAKDDINLRQLRLMVEDTGIGIPKEKLEIIFEQFVHVDSIYARKQGGTGLGLALCKSYLKLMGGSIQVKSEVGVGTRFTCAIPFTLPA